MSLETRLKDSEYQKNEGEMSKKLTIGSLFAGIGGFRSWT